MKRSDIRIVLSDIYDIIYKISVGNDAHPLTTVLVHDKENYFNNDPYERYMREYMDKGVKRLGYTFAQFIKLPKYKIKSIIKVLDSYNKDEGKALDALKEDLEED